MKSAAFIAVVALWFTFLFQRTVYQGPYTYDEADYAYAASRGVLTNAFDSRGPSLWEFVRLGLASGRDQTRRSEFSESVRGKDDTVLYRHSHGPLFYYLLYLLLRVGFSEHAVRFTMLVFPLASLVVVFLGSLWVLPAKERFRGAILASVLAIWNYASAKTSEVAPHQFFALLYLAALMLLAKFITTGSRKFWYLAVLSTAVAFCTLEVSLVLIVTLGIVAYLEREQLHPDWALVWRSALLFIAIVFVLWPGAILRFSIVRSYLIYTYLLFFRKGQWGDFSLAYAWRTRLLDNPLDWLLLIAAVLIFFANPHLPVRRIARPFLIFGALMLLTVLRVASDSPRYVLPFLQAFDVFAAFVLASDLARFHSRVCPPVLVASICVAAGLFAWIAIARHPTGQDPRLPAVLSSIRARYLTEKSLLVPQEEIPSLHYYFPRARLRGYRESQPTSADFEGRHFDAILFPGYPFRFEMAGQSQARSPE